jgi:hypothetical protein
MIIVAIVIALCVVRIAFAMPVAMSIARIALRNCARRKRRAQ